MFMDWFVFDLVICNFINDYDGVAAVLDGFGWVQGESKLATNDGFNDWTRFNLLLIANMLLVYIWLRNDLWCIWLGGEIECDGFGW